MKKFKTILMVLALTMFSSQMTFAQTCIPATECLPWFECGQTNNGCGGTIELCGTCPVGELSPDDSHIMVYTCEDNVCVCFPFDNECSAGFNCGTMDDGCGSPIECGTCSGRDICVNNVCETPAVTITGTVSGAVQEGVDIELYTTVCGGDELLETVTTALTGNFIFTDLLDGSYYVVPLETNYTFSPVGLFLTISGISVSGVDFTAAAKGFIDNGDGTVTDTLTDLIWLQNANCDQPQNWNDAALFVSGLDNGDCGLSDGSASGDWRLPTKDELQSIGTDPPRTWYGGFPRATWTMPSAPFTIDPASDHGSWSGDRYSIYMWITRMSDGNTAYTRKSSMRDVWPVKTCIPATECTEEFNCGTEADGCGGTINCGTCSGEDTCEDNVCVCIPTKTECTAGFNCGEEDDGCGGTIDCGSCGAGEDACVDNICNNEDLEEIIVWYCPEVAFHTGDAIDEMDKTYRDMKDCSDEYDDCLTGLNPTGCLLPYAECIRRGINILLADCNDFYRRLTESTTIAMEEAALRGIEDEFTQWLYSPASEECLGEAKGVSLVCEEISSYALQPGQ
jgi:hypothetical protein